MPAIEIHDITRQFTAAAMAAAPEGSQVRNDLRASDKDASSMDSLNVKIFRIGSKSDFDAVVDHVLQSLNRVATNNGLRRDAPSESREGILFHYRRAGVVTHVIHIHEGPAISSSRRGQDGEIPKAKLAIILDDLGSDLAASDAIFKLPYPLTISVLPGHPHSTDIAEEAHRRGYEVMLHLPMQSIGKEQPERTELRAGMSTNQISGLVDQFLQSVPGVSGVNNHQGSQATADGALMSELMPVLHERKLFYVDSRTTADTVAYEVAQRDGVPSGFRNVPFLDDLDEVAAVRKQLRIAFREASKNGEGIAIGHAHAATLQALREVLPQAHEQGVRLVFASQMVH